jgi:hypothetical protein
VLRGGIRAEESAIDWLDEVAAELNGQAMSARAKIRGQE